MTDEEALTALADACGVAGDYRDFRNQPVATALPVRAQVLARMGICGAQPGPDDVHRALAALDDATWSRALPATLVVTAGTPLTLPLRLAGDSAADDLSLLITAADGEQHRFTLDAAAAPVLETRETGAGRRELREVSLTPAIAPGYYRAELCGDAVAQTPGGTRLIVTPQQAFRPPALHDGGRLFGFSVQLYTLRSERNWGIGDFSDLRELVRAAAPEGADIIGVSPLHALFPANPLHTSPYSPSNRAFLNTLYIDPEAVADFAACDDARSLLQDRGFRAELQRLRAAHAVDYAGVAAAKQPVLDMLYRQFRTAELANDSPRARDFRRFVDSGGEPLFLHALFDCLHEHFLAADPGMWGWPVWPEAYRDPRGRAAQDFARRHAERLEFFLYLQWCAEQQLAEVQALAKALGMATGIYLDLAVGVDRAGSEVWSNQSAFAVEASAGAPPDELARSGQDWGFPPLDPRPLADSGYDLFIRNVRASMARAGAVRYDHAVSLERLWWIPEPGDAAQGAFVHYDLDALLGLLALESQREQCLVIGEDLGTLPPRLRECMAARHVFSYKVLYFEKQDGRMRVPAEYQREATATITTHDLATLASWWDGSDIELRAGLGLLGTEAVAEQLRQERAYDRQQLLFALRDHGGWQGSIETADTPAMHTALSVCIHRFLARSNAAVMLTQLEDLMEMHRPVNVPGTSDEHANWQRKLRWPLEGLLARPGVQALCAAIREGRGQSRRDGA